MGWRKVKGKNYEVRDIKISKEKSSIADTIYTIVGFILMFALIGWVQKLFVSEKTPKTWDGKNQYE